MKKIIFLLVSVLFLEAQTLHIEHFATDIFSSTSKELEKVNMSLVIEGRYVEDENFKVIDTLNVVIGSFYIENLATSQGKENLKKLLIKYSAKKYGVDIDEIYILNFSVEKNRAFDIDEMIKRMKDEGCCPQHP